MKRREFLEAALTLSVTPLVSSCVPAVLDAVFTNYINNKIEQREKQAKEELRKDLEGIKENVISLKTSNSFLMETDAGDYPMKIPAHGKGLIYGDYILTVNKAMLINETSIRESLSRRGLKLVGVRVLSKRISVNNQPLEQIVANSEKDVAILKIPNGYKKPDYKIKLGNGGDLRTMDKIFTFGTSSDDKTVVKEGIVGNDGFVKYVGADDVEFSGKVASFSISPYEVGSPVINKSGEIIGLISHANEFSSIFRPINWYKEEIEKYEKKRMS